MDFVKQLSRPLLLFLLGVLMLVFASSKTVKLGSLEYASDASNGSRLALIALGVGIILMSAVWQWRHKPVPDEMPPFLSTLEDVESFDSFVAGSKRITIVVRTGINVLMSYERMLIEACTSGCEVRFVYVNPNAAAATLVYGHSASTYARNLAASEEQLEALHERVGPRLQIQVSDDIPPFSMIYAERDARSRIRIQLNFLFSRIGRDRPVFELGADDPWYQAFRDEVEAIWQHSRPRTS